MTIESTGTVPAPEIDRRRVAELTDAAARAPHRAHAQLGRVLRARAQGDAEGRALLLPGERPVAGLHRARQGRAGLGRGRQRVHRLPQRLRRDVRRAREPAGRGGRQASASSSARTSPPRPRARSRVAEELRRRFGLPQWRFTNSGTESTMDAIHLARGATGRDMILKIEGSYHGHHDAVMVSVYPALEELGDRDDPVSVPYGAGLPARDHRADALGPVQRRAGARASVLERFEGQVAALIMEPAMMNINIVPPVDGYLEDVRRITAEHGVKLIFDEVKTGATISPGGATQRFGVTPDMVTLAKASCGGLPGGAIGMTEELARGRRGRHRAPVRDVQRQPAGDGGRAGDAHRGPDRRGLRAARAHQRPRCAAAATRSSSATASPATPRASAPRAASCSPRSRCASTATTSRRSTTTCPRSRGSTT